MNPWIQVTGWTLIHFVWQGAVLAAATAAGLAVCRRRSPQMRYGIACFGLVAMLASAGATAAYLSAPGAFVAAGDVVRPIVAGSDLSPAAARIADVSMFAPGATGSFSVDAWLSITVWSWLAGVTLLLARFSGGCWRVHRLRGASVAEPVSPWQATAGRLAERLGVGVAFRVVESRLVDAPTVIGWLRPVILLPLAVVTNLSPGQIEALLVHELAHIRRRDYVVNVVQTVAEALLFFHPGVWWVSSRIRAEREHCCDDAAVDVCGEAASYAEALAEIASWRTRGAALSVGAAGGPLLARIRRLVLVPEDDAPRAVEGPVMLVASIALAVAVAVLSPGPLANAEGADVAAQSPAEGSRVRRTDHFEIHYPPSLDLHAERIARDAERAYEHISGDLKHNLAFSVPIVLFGTTKELEQSVPAGGLGPTHAASFTDPSRDRILLAVDRPADQWLGIVTHEVAHVFGFDILPGATTPLWIQEGLAEYQRAAWDPTDLVVLRDAVRNNTLPRITALGRDGGGAAPRLVQALGHAAFDFIESRWGKAGVRQFLFTLRQATRGGGDPYEAAFRVSAADFERGFEQYLTQRFAAAAPAPAERFDYGASLRVEGDITDMRSAAPAGLACLELWAPSQDGSSRRWAVECGDDTGQEVLRALKPGDRVIVTGAPAREPGVRRLVIQGLVRPADGFTWRRPSG